MGTKVVDTRIKLKNDTTQHWNEARGFIPLEGELIVYNDFSSFVGESNGEIVVKYIPNFKIGDGKAYVQDLPFVNEELRDKLVNHMSNNDIHVTKAEKLFWNNKININDSGEVTGETLLINRN